MADMVRVNARVSTDVNKWLDEYSQNSGVSKSTIVYMALEQFKTTKQATDGFKDMTALAEQINSSMDSYEKQLKDLKKELKEIKKRNEC